MDANKQFWREFLKMYQELPCLWNFKCPDYSKRMVRNNAYKILAEKFKEIYPEANKQLLLKKINIIRTCYRRESRKLKESQKTGAIYVPNLWYFNLLSFLDDLDSDDDCQKTVHDYQSIYDRSISRGFKEGHKEEFFYPPRKLIKQADRRKLQRLKGDSINKHRKEKQELTCRAPELIQRTKNIKAIEPTETQLFTSDSARTSEKNAILSSTWGILYSDLDPRQKLFANKAINEVLYQGALGKLHEYSYKAIEDNQQLVMNKDENFMDITIDRVNYNDPEYLERFRHINNVRDALKYLKPLEEYAMRENHAAVELICQLEDTLRNWPDDSKN